MLVLGLFIFFLVLFTVIDYLDNRKNTEGQE